MIGLDTTGFYALEFELSGHPGEGSRERIYGCRAGGINSPGPTNNTRGNPVSQYKNSGSPAADALFTVSDDGTKVPLVILRIPESNSVGGYYG